MNQFFGHHPRRGYFRGSVAAAFVPVRQTIQPRLAPTRTPTWRDAAEAILARLDREDAAASSGQDLGVSSAPAPGRGPWRSPYLASLGIDFNRLPPENQALFPPLAEAAPSGGSSAVEPAPVPLARPGMEQVRTMEFDNARDGWMTQAYLRSTGDEAADTGDPANAGDAAATEAQPGLSVADLPYPEPRNDHERIENALWLLDNNPDGRALLPVASSEQANESIPSRQIGAKSPSNLEEIPEDMIESMRRAGVLDDRESSGGPSISNLFGLIGTAEAQSRSSRGAGRQFTLAERAAIRYYHSLQVQLGRLEPNNPDTASIHTRDWVPTFDQLRQMESVLAQARARAGFGNAPFDPRGGDNLQTIIGDLAHRLYSERFDPNAGWNFRYRFPTGGRPDAVLLRDHRVNEQKPATPSGIAVGRPQLRNYGREYELQHGLSPTLTLDLYYPRELARHYLGIQDYEGK